jgi:hypothetical protein
MLRFIHQKKEHNEALDEMHLKTLSNQINIFKREQHNLLFVLLHSEIPLFGWTAGQDVTSDGVIKFNLTKTRLVTT